MIRFVSTFGTDVTAGSQKLHIAAVTTTYKMAFDFDLNDINGIRWDALFYVKKGQKKVAEAARGPSRKEAVGFTLDTQAYVEFWAGAAPDDQLSDAQLQLKVLVLLRICGFRSMDLASTPAGIGAGFRWVGSDLEIRAFNTKTASSKGDVSRHGWTEFCRIRQVDTDRLSKAWALTGLDLEHPERVCPVRAFRSLAMRFEAL